MTAHAPPTGGPSLLDQAERIAARAHAPYSHFRVGAVVVLPDGSTYEGCNVENAAYGSSVCAEVNAITTAVADGATQIDTVAVVSLDGAPCTPCGGCRQVMREFGVQRIIMRNGDGELIEFSLDELLPESFGPEDLGP
jgi:cytidine deaminase